LALAAQKITDARDTVARGIDRPNPQVTDTSAGECPSLKKMIERRMGGMRIGSDPASDLTRVQLLPRHADKQIEGPTCSRATP